MTWTNAFDWRECTVLVQRIINGPPQESTVRAKLYEGTHTKGDSGEFSDGTIETSFSFSIDELGVITLEVNASEFQFSGHGNYGLELHVIPTMLDSEETLPPCRLVAPLFGGDANYAQGMRSTSDADDFTFSSVSPADPSPMDMTVSDGYYDRAAARAGFAGA
jgi:hypothetical protein